MDCLVRRASALVIAGVVVAAAGPAFAHVEGVGLSGGFASGFLHPLFGWDHVAAMVAVGLLGALLGPPALFVLPIVFPLVMALGGAAGVAGVPLPGVEVGIAMSAVVLGLAVASGWRAPLWLAGAAVAIFAVFHGHAHGAELPLAADATAYALGFVVGTSLLHLLGIAVGSAARWNAGRVAVRAAGGAIAIAGMAFLTGAA
ncbi:HupE/UreJ family protein [Acuticoccus mangrovi]|uniref:HupE/UreJ family protein n=1 Tax=Acuticoccus mangrovi TaxID=2796142 RepID=A0A934MEK5_9HYPH|nr:HupE/UreJ family protein [Acuticoccus mangrovi]MBJ3777627.1 HupE/UreJ family protein [Acuticoccus mangrovi]